MKNINVVKNFLTGKWKNEFISNKKTGSEICEIKEDGRYFINGEHWFNIVDFKYDADTNKISFIKSAVKFGDDRKFYNTVLVIDNNYLTNCINDTDLAKDYSISYTRLSS